MIKQKDKHSQYISFPYLVFDSVHLQQPVVVLPLYKNSPNRRRLEGQAGGRWP